MWLYFYMGVCMCTCSGSILVGQFKFCGVCAFVWEEILLLHMLVQCFLPSRCSLQSSATVYCDVNTCLCAYAFGCACVRMLSGVCVFGCSLLSAGCHGRNGSKHTHAVGYGGIQYTSNPGLKFLSKHVPVTCIGKHGLIEWLNNCITAHVHQFLPKHFFRPLHAGVCGSTRNDTFVSCVVYFYFCRETYALPNTNGISRRVGRIFLQHCEQHLGNELCNGELLSNVVPFFLLCYYLRGLRPPVSLLLHSRKFTLQAKLKNYKSSESQFL